MLFNVTVRYAVAVLPLSVFHSLPMNCTHVFHVVIAIVGDESATGEEIVAMHLGKFGLRSRASMLVRFQHLAHYQHARHIWEKLEAALWR